MDIAVIITTICTVWKNIKDCINFNTLYRLSMCFKWLSVFGDYRYEWIKGDVMKGVYNLDEIKNIYQQILKTWNPQSTKLILLHEAMELQEYEKIFSLNLISECALQLGELNEYFAAWKIVYRMSIQKIEHDIVDFVQCQEAMIHIQNIINKIVERIPKLSIEFDEDIREEDDKRKQTDTIIWQQIHVLKQKVKYYIDNENVDWYMLMCTSSVLATCYEKYLRKYRNYLLSNLSERSLFYISLYNSETLNLYLISNTSYWENYLNALANTNCQDKKWVERVSY